jgi:hypothetical protein
LLQLGQQLAWRSATAACGFGDPDHFLQDQHQLFRRMVFNILMDNTDDHHKNHALIRPPHGHYRLSPACDVVPSGQGLGQQGVKPRDIELLAQYIDGPSLLTQRNEF